MGFSLKSGESTPEGVRRVVLEEVTAAAEQLRNTSGTDRDKAIHEARKSIKKTRSVLRLMRRELGEIRRVENVHLRDISQELSRLRDASVLLEVLDGLAEVSGKRLGEGIWTAIRRRLEARKKQVESEVDAPALATRSAESLDSFAARVQEWPLSRDGFGALAPGFLRSFDQGRDALHAAMAGSSAENFHEWRKRVKDHWYHVRLLQDLWPAMMDPYLKTLKELETWLGDDHNLTVLEEAVVSDPEMGLQARQRTTVVKAIAARQEYLRRCAVESGKRIYAIRPKDLKRTVHALWDLWREKPLEADTAK